MVLEKIGDELSLGNGQSEVGTIPVNFQAQKLSGRPQVTEFEVGRQLLNKRIKIGSLLASQSKIINKDREENPNVVPLEDVETMI